MTTDLFKIYKMYSQRVHRNPASLEHKEIKEIMKYMLTKKLTREEMLELANTIHSIESNLGARKIYATDVIQAIQSNNYTIIVPYQVQHKWNEKADDMGWLFLAVSNRKPDQIKIAASKIPPWKYESTYSHKWGYEIVIIWRRWVEKPHSLKDKVKKRLRAQLVSGLTDGDSNEWYYRFDGETDIINKVKLLIEPQSSAGGFEQRP